ncbi:MAG: hypothetical protein CVU18_11050 [Betaproteobacteria bacterium HGW-Betaproteobacteria-12]|nr:MAG: hypothetical protein CVU18_11050 [Betaproteobacteria bacterium HGW-Betaproteobacteria-12]
MLTKAPECRRVCKDEPGAVMDELVAALVRLRGLGLSEAEALHMSGDPVAVARMFPEGSMGKFPSIAKSFVDSGCAECAVNKAFTDPAPPTAENDGD